MTPEPDDSPHSDGRTDEPTPVHPVRGASVLLAGATGGIGGIGGALADELHP